MAIRLQLKDGTVKEYSFKEKPPAEHGKTPGFSDSRVEEAIEVRKGIVLGQRKAMATSPVLTIFIIAGMFFLARDLPPSDTILIAGAAAIFVLFDIAYVVFTWRWVKRLKVETRELQEFRDNQTVNGIPAIELREPSPVNRE